MKVHIALHFFKRYYTTFHYITLYHIIVLYYIIAYQNRYAIRNARRQEAENAARRQSLPCAYQHESLVMCM